MKKYLPLVLLFALLISSCGGMMGGAEGGMMARHHAQVPAEYAGMTAPNVTEESIASGAKIYAANCATCHGETGMGEGAGGSALNPKPSAIAHTTQMLADDLVYYRVSEGGAEFQTAMPAWKAILNEEQRWDVIAYARSLGQDNAAQIEQVRATQQATMLKDAVSKGAVTQAEADVFNAVHVALENYIQTNNPQGTMTERETNALAALVKEKTLTQEQVDEFNRVHEILASGGFMP